MKRIVLFVLLALSATGAFAQMSDEQVVKLLMEARQQGKSQRGDAVDVRWNRGWIRIS